MTVYETERKTIFNELLWDIVLQNIHGHMVIMICQSQHIHLLWRFGFSCSAERWKVFSLEGPLLGYESLLIITTHQERPFSSVKWYLYIYFWTVHFHLVISIISTVSRRKSLHFIDSFREGKKYKTTHASFLLRKAITVARTTALPLALSVVFIFLGVVIQSLTSP